MNKNTQAYLFIILGPLFYSLGINLFISPLGLYSGGIYGICQLIRTIIINNFSLGDYLNKIDIAGIISMLTNIPLLILAYKSISKKFFIRTFISIICCNLFLTFFTFNDLIILDDTLASCLIGGTLSGIGVGLTLRAGSSTGGADIIGMYLVKKNSRLTVAQVGLIINIILYINCAILFNVETAIYSIIFSLIETFAIDKFHSQNIKVNALIFTNNYEIAKEINKKLVRGSTSWEGKGDYTGNKKYIISTVISKYEETDLKQIVHELDSNAFVVINTNVDTVGYVQKHLDA